MNIFNGFKQLFKQKEEKTMTNFSDLQAKRRSIYALGKDVELTNQELIDTIQDVYKRQLMEIFLSILKYEAVILIVHLIFQQQIQNSVQLPKIMDHIG